MGFFDSNSALPLIVGLPACVALALATLGLLLNFIGLGELPARVWRAIGLSAAIVNFALAVRGLAFGFDPERLGFQLSHSFGWSDALGAQLVLGVDGIGLCFLLSIAALAPLSMLASWATTEESVRSWMCVVLLLESSLLGAVASLNFLSFTFFWALALIPILLWLGRWGGPGRARAASRLWTVESASLACLLFVAFVLRESSLEQFGVATLGLLPYSPDVHQTLLDIRLDLGEQRLLFGVLTVGLATRLPLVPFHFWVSAAHSAAPSGLSMLLVTGFVQTAAIGLLRFGLPLFPDAAAEAGPLLSWLGIGALVYASLIALVQKELKRLIAYASIGYAGFAVFGISTLNVQGVTGAVIQLLVHGMATAALFALVGFLSIRRGTTEVAAFGGLAKPMPVCSFFFGVMVLSLMGLPLLGGFVGDLFVLLGSIESRRKLSLLALLAMVVAASYLLWVQRRIFLGPVDEPANRGLIDLDRVERAIVLALAIPILWIGVYPNPVLRRVEPAVLEILYQMGRRSSAGEAIDVEAATKLVTRGPGARAGQREAERSATRVGRTP